MPTTTSNAVLRRIAESSRAAQRDHRRPGGSYDLTHRELLGLQQICARLCRGPHLTEREQAAVGRMLHRLLNEPPHRGLLRSEPVYGLIRKQLPMPAVPMPR